MATSTRRSFTARQIAWGLLTFPPLFLVYTTVPAAGMRAKFAYLATPVWKAFPLLSSWRNYEIGRRIDLALPLCFLILLIVAVMYHFGLKMLLIDNYRPLPWMKPDVTRRFITALCGVILPIDLLLFWQGMREQRFIAEGDVLWPLIATVAYGAVLIAISFITIALGRTEEA